MEISVISHIKNYFQSFKPIAVISLLLFFTGCSVYTAYQQKIMEMQGLMDDDRASMENTAEKMRPGEIAPDWQQPMDELEIDEMAELPDGNVLAGFLKIEPVYGYPDYGPLVSLDPETGEENWRYKRSGNSNHQFNLAMTDPVILVERLDSRGKGSIYAAVDIDSGEELWTVKTDSNHTFTSTPDNNTIFIAETGKRKLSYRSYHTLSGDELWEMTLEDHIDVSSLDFVNGQLLSIGNKTRSLDPSDGNINWTAQIPGGSVTEDNYLLFDDGLVVPGGKSRLNRIGFEGRVEWSTTLPEAPDLLSTGNNLLFAVMQDTSGTSFRVAALSLENGSLQWTANIAGELKSPPLVNKNKVVFTSLVDEKHRKLVFIDIEKGRTARMVDFPAAVETVLGDQLIPYEKHLVVVCETAVAAYSWDKSKWLWRHSILPDNNMKESLKFATNAHVRLFRVQGADDSELNTDEYNRAMRESASQFSLLARAKSRQASTFQRTESGIQSSSRAERIAAHETRKIAIEHSIIAANMEFQWQRTAAGVDMLSTGFNAIANAKENAETRFAQAAIQRSRIQYPTTVELHNRSVHDRYFVRAHRERRRGPHRWSILVVDTKTGHWNDISVGPFSDHYLNKTYSFGAIGIQYPILTSDGILVTKGLGLNPDQWDPTTIGTGRVYQPSLLGYQISEDDLHEPNQQYNIGRPMIIDKKGNTVGVPGQFYHISSFSEGIAKIGKMDEENTLRYGTINREGEIIVPPQYENIYYYSEGLAAFEKDGKIGFIDPAGNVVIEPQFNSLGVLYNPVYGFQEGLAHVEVNNSSAYIDKKGNYVIPPGKFSLGGPFAEGLARIQKAGSSIYARDKYGYINTDGELVIPYQFYRASNFSGGLALVTPALENGEDSGKGGIINTSGEYVVGPTEEWNVYASRPFSEGMAPVTDPESGNIGFIDRMGNWVIQPEFQSLYKFSNGRNAVRKNDMWRFIDKNGAFVQAGPFKYVSTFSEGLAAVYKDGEWGYIRTDGSWAIPPKYSNAGSFNSGRAVVQLPGKRWVTVSETE